MIGKGNEGKNKIVQEKIMNTRSVDQNTRNRIRPIRVRFQTFCFCLETLHPTRKSFLEVQRLIGLIFEISFLPLFCRASGVMRSVRIAKKYGGQAVPVSYWVDWPA